MNEATQTQSQQANFQRDEKTGLIIGYPYKFTPEGRIDWRSLVDSKFLYVANEYKDRVVKEQGKPLDQIDILTVKDDWLRIRLGGINQLANLRGYRSLEYELVTATESKAACVCRMEFIGNYETDGYPVICSAIASATLRSVDKNFSPYLETFAENRAFARCVKRALQINILSDIEIGGESKKGDDSSSVSNGDEGETSATTTNSNQGFEPYDRLKELCSNPSPMSPISFDALKKTAVEHYKSELKSDPTEWTGFESIQPIDAYVLIGKIKEKQEKLLTANKSQKKK